MLTKTKLLIIHSLRPLYIAYAAIIIALALVGAYLHFGLPFAKASFDPAAVVAQMGKGEKDVFADVRDSMKQIINEGGIQGMIDVNEYALTHNLYGIYQCHVISHMTGHEAVVFYGSDYDAVMKHDNHFCEVGYRHGAEAQVALSGGDYKNELYKMCDAIKRKNPEAECFHGAGHAFMNETLDVDESLRMCGELINETHSEEDIIPCYNAVFAELTNLVGGTDGGTGIEYTGGAPLSLLEESPLSYCAKFDKEHYRVQCVFEFSGLGISEFSTPADIEDRLKRCSDSSYDEVLESACIQSVSAVGAQHMLATNSSIEVPPHIFDLPPSLRKAYIVGVATEMHQYMLSGAPRDAEGFCANFTEPEDHALCAGVFN